jgi:hypothetical protein
MRKAARAAPPKMSVALTIKTFMKIPSLQFGDQNEQFHISDKEVYEELLKVFQNNAFFPTPTFQYRARRERLARHPVQVHYLGNGGIKHLGPSGRNPITALQIYVIGLLQQKRPKTKRNSQQVAPLAQLADCPINREIVRSFKTNLRARLNAIVEQSPVNR